MSERETLRQHIVDWLDDRYHFGEADALIRDDDMSFLDNGILTSLGFVELIVHLEDHYGVVIDRKSISRDNFDGMNKILDMVLGHSDWKGIQ